MLLKMDWYLLRSLCFFLSLLLHPLCIPPPLVLILPLAHSHISSSPFSALLLRPSLSSLQKGRSSMIRCRWTGTPPFSLRHFFVSSLLATPPSPLAFSLTRPLSAYVTAKGQQRIPPALHCSPFPDSSFLPLSLLPRPPFVVMS